MAKTLEEAREEAARREKEGPYLSELRDILDRSYWVETDSDIVDLVCRVVLLLIEREECKNT